MSLRYSQKTNPNYQKLVTSLGNNRSLGVKSFYIPPAAGQPWQRPADWLAVTPPSSSEQKVVCLVAVFPDNNSNLLAFTVSGNYTVDWGDGVTENFSSGVKSSHQYDFNAISNSNLTSEGIKQVIVTITPQGAANLTSLNFRSVHSSAVASNLYSQPILELYISASSCTSLSLGNTSGVSQIITRLIYYVNFINIGALTSFYELCASLCNLRKVEFGTVNSNVTDSRYMFYLCSNITEIPAFNISKVTNASYMFSGCFSLKIMPLLDFSSCTVMDYMYQNCFSLVSIPQINTSKVTSFYGLFTSCTSLKTIPTISTVSATSTQYMFDGCTGLVTAPYLDTRNVTSFEGMFRNCRGITKIPLYNTVKVSSFLNTFQNCVSLETIPPLNTGNATDFTSMFNGCTSLISIPLIDTSKATQFVSMFSSCASLKTVPAFNSPNVVSTSSMFANCLNLREVPLFNTSKVTVFASMFSRCNQLFTVPLFDMASCTNATSMFNTCYALTGIPTFNLSACQTATTMFNACYSLLTIPSFDTRNLVTATNMFASCVNLLSASFMDLSKVTGASSMFSSCNSLVYVPFYNTRLVASWGSMFQNCFSLREVPPLSAGAGTDFTNTFAGCPSLASAALSGTVNSISYSSCFLSKSALETVFNNLGRLTAGRTITISNNWGANGARPEDTAYSRTATSTAGSTTITMADTSSLSAGMQVTGNTSPLVVARAVTFQDTGDTVTLTSHGLLDGDEVAFATITTTTGIITNTIYYVVNALTDTFQVAATPGGAALPLTSNGSGSVRYRTEIVSIVPNTSVTVSRPMSVSNTLTHTFRFLRTGTALLKNWTVTG